MGLEIHRALTQLEQPEDYRQVLEQIQAENGRQHVLQDGVHRANVEGTLRS